MNTPIPRGSTIGVTSTRMDKDNTQAACPDCITTGLTVDLPPIEATVCAVNKNKKTRGMIDLTLPEDELALPVAE